MSSKFTLSLLLFLFIFINLIQLLPVQEEIKFILTHLNYSYQDKMLRQFGPDYSYIHFIQLNTAKNAIIATPPRGAPWWNFGSSTVLDYFLWPRTLIEGSVTNSFLPKNADYAMVVWFTMETSPSAKLDWPLVDLNKYNVKYFQKSNPIMGLINLKND